MPQNFMYEAREIFCTRVCLPSEAARYKFKICLCTIYNQSSINSWSWSSWAYSAPSDRRGSTRGSCTWCQSGTSSFALSSGDGPSSSLTSCIRHQYQPHWPGNFNVHIIFSAQFICDCLVQCACLCIYIHIVWISHLPCSRGVPPSSPSACRIWWKMFTLRWQTTTTVRLTWTARSGSCVLSPWGPPCGEPAPGS